MLWMLFFMMLLINSFERIHSLQCYRCTEDYVSPLNWTITTDNFPPLGSTCKLAAAEHQCVAKIFVLLENNYTTQTEITYGYDPTNMKDPTTKAPGHYVRLGASRQLIVVSWSHSIQYNCVTDGCNSADNLRRVLNATTRLTQVFEQLDSLISPTQFFNASSCLDFSNSTTQHCDPSVDVNTCGQCSLDFDTNGHQACARCVKFDPYYANSVTRYALFRLSDRSQSDQFTMQCSNKDCNIPSNFERIQQTSTILFDFNQFPGSTAAISISLNTLFLFFALLLGRLLLE